MLIHNKRPVFPPDAPKDYAVRCTPCICISTDVQLRMGDVRLCRWPCSSALYMRQCTNEMFGSALHLATKGLLLQDLARQCMATKPKERPTFTEVEQRVDAMLANSGAANGTQ